MNHAPAITQEGTELSRLLGELAREAQAFRFEVAPNPTVGAAILSEGLVIARGYHEYWGGPHAEVRAIEAAHKSGVPASAWDTLVVTLDPCTSFGKTPPCTDLVLTSGIPHIVSGSSDPDPRERGKALEMLRLAGRRVESLAATPVERWAPHFVRWIGHERLRRPRPWTIAKWAQTRSGHLNPPAEIGDGRWISGPQALAQVQVLRSRVDAIVTGVSTVLADDPRLTLRPSEHATGREWKAPRRIVLDSFLRTPPTARLFQAPGAGEYAGEVHILCQAGADGARHRELAARGAKITSLHSTDMTHISLRELQEWLWSQGLRRVLVESGPELLSRYLEAGFVDQLRVFTGNVSGGQGETMAHWFAQLKLDSRRDAEVGQDQVFEAFVQGQTAG